MIRLTGTGFAPAAPAGDAVHVQEYWRVLQPGPPGLRAYLHLVDGQGNLWAQADSLGYYAEDWQAGDSAINDQTLDIPPYSPPVPMKLLFGLYSPSSGQQLGKEVSPIYYITAQLPPTDEEVSFLATGKLPEQE